MKRLKPGRFIVRPLAVLILVAYTGQAANAGLFNTITQQATNTTTKILGFGQPQAVKNLINKGGQGLNSLTGGGQQQGGSSGAGMAAGALMGLFSSQGINDATKALGAGQREQMQTEVKVTDQKNQELNLATKQLEAARTASEYLGQTGPAASLPGMVPGQSCGSTVGAAGLGTSSTVRDQARSAVSMGALNTLVISAGDAKANPGAAASEYSGTMDAAALGPADLTAESLYSSKSGNQASYARTVLNPIPLEPLTEAQAATPAGQRFMAAGNATNAALSLAGESMGFVASDSVASASSETVNAAASMVATGQPNGQGVPTSTSPGSADAAASGVTKAAIPGYTAKTTPDSEAWVGKAGNYADAIRQASSATGIPAALILALQQGEGGSILSNMPCPTGQRVTYFYHGSDSLHCTGSGYSAKSLFQMIDATANSTNALSGHVLLAMSNAPAEFSAMAQVLKNGYSQCGGNPACTAAWWNLHAGSGLGQDERAFVNQCRAGQCPDPSSYNWANAAYVKSFLGRYAQDGGTAFSGYAPGVYAGATAVAGQPAQSGSSASDGDLMRLISYGVYANPDWITFLATTNEEGAWRAITFMLAMKMATQNKQHELMEHIVAMQAAQLAQATIATRDAHLPRLRGAAMSQSIF